MLTFNANSNYHGRLERAEQQMYMCAAEKVAEEKFSGEPSARGEGSESLESLESLDTSSRSI